MRLVRGACPFPSEIVSFSIRMKTTPTKTVASSERIAPGLLSSTASHQLAQLARGRREEPRGRPPEKMTEHDPDQYCDHEGQAGNVMDGFADVVRNRLVVGEECPGFEGQQQEDGANGGSDEEGEKVAPVENQPFPATRNFFSFFSPLAP